MGASAMLSDDQRWLLWTVGLGISRALLDVDADYRKLLKSAGLLTRDPRMKERKKYGLKKARKASQFSKR